MSDGSPLESLLAAAAHDRSRVPAFLDALLAATVIVPGVVEADGVTLKLATLAGAGGASVQPFYTSEARLQETIAVIPAFESRYVGLPTRVLWETSRGSTLVLNPHSANGKEFLPGEIAQLLEGVAALQPRVVERETTVMVGVPASVPPGMEAALVAVFEAHQAVEGAWLGWKVTPESGDQNYLVVVTGPEGIREELSGELGRALVHFSQAHPVDLMFPGPGETNPLAGIAPIFDRSR